MAFIKRTLRFASLVIWCRILFDIGEVALHLLLIAVAFCPSRGVHLFNPWLQIPAEGSGLEHIYTCNRSYSFALFHPHILCSILPPCRSDQLHGWRGEPWQARGGGGSEGDMSVNQRLRRMRWDRHLLLVMMNYSDLSIDSF